MFTGLTLGPGLIRKRLVTGEEARLWIEPAFDWESPLVLGESVAVSGVCLTVTETEGRRGFTAHASAETLRRSTLGRVEKVNLERALALGGRLGGHLVSGHADGLGWTREIRPVGQSLIFRFETRPELAVQIVPKGSICLDGVSLTVNETLGSTDFTVNLIPHTLTHTTLGSLRPGDEVNLETDLIGKYVQRFLALRPERAESRESLTRDFLARHGFIAS